VKRVVKLRWTQTLVIIANLRDAQTMKPSQDPCEHIASIRYPILSFDELLAATVADDEDTRRDGAEQMLEQITAQHEEFAEALGAACSEADGADPLLSELRSARARIDYEMQYMRRLFAYGRRFVGTRPYTLQTLATAADMSFSGVKTAFSPDDVAYVARHTRLTPRPDGSRSNAGES
jgi:hypothetical protein